MALWCGMPHSARPAGQRASTARELGRQTSPRGPGELAPSLPMRHGRVVRPRVPTNNGLRTGGRLLRRLELALLRARAGWRGTCSPDTSSASTPAPLFARAVLWPSQGDRSGAVTRPDPPSHPGRPGRTPPVPPAHGAPVRCRQLGEQTRRARREAQSGALGRMADAPGRAAPRPHFRRRGPSRAELAIRPGRSAGAPGSGQANHVPLRIVPASWPGSPNPTRFGRHPEPLAQPSREWAEPSRWESDWRCRVGNVPGWFRPGHSGPSPHERDDEPRRNAPLTCKGERASPWLLSRSRRDLPVRRATGAPQPTADES